MWKPHRRNTVERMEDDTDKFSDQRRQFISDGTDSQPLAAPVSLSPNVATVLRQGLSRFKRLVIGAISESMVHSTLPRNRRSRKNSALELPPRIDIKVVPLNGSAISTIASGDQPVSGFGRTWGSLSSILTVAGNGDIHVSRQSCVPETCCMMERLSLNRSASTPVRVVRSPWPCMSGQRRREDVRLPRDSDVDSAAYTGALEFSAAAATFYWDGSAS
jgi:hypothetical protein